MHTSMPPRKRHALEVGQEVCEAVSRGLLPVSWDSRAKVIDALHVKSALANVVGELTALDSESPAPPNDDTLKIQPTRIANIAVAKIFRTIQCTGKEMQVISWGSS